MILLVYIATLILNPTAWTALLPIIIPTGILTIGIPAYAIIKNTKNTLEKNEVKQTATIDQQLTTNTIEEKSTKKTHTNNQIQSNQVYLNLDLQDQPTKQEKNKIKAKGTRP